MSTTADAIRVLRDLKLPQRQDSTNDQLHDLYHLANAAGLYDAADVVRNLTEGTPR